jgi:hypothetical protein
MSFFSIPQVQQQQDQARAFAFLAVGRGIPPFAGLARSCVAAIPLPNSLTDAPNAMTPGEVECLQQIQFVGGIRPRPPQIG